MTTVAVYQMPSHQRSKIIVDAMMRGIKSAGDTPILKWVHHYQHVDADIAVLYGYEGRAVNIFQEYSRYSKVVFVDLGYWGRHHGGRFAGYHKITINSRHPVSYFQDRPRPLDRFNKLNVPIKSWRNNDGHILLCGMGAKGAQACGLVTEEWEKSVIKQIKSVTSRPILYRPKPSWRGARPINGTLYNQPQSSFQEVLVNSHCVVSHHSNCNVDGLMEGIPSFCVDGVASALSCGDFSKIETPFKPGNREQWAADLAYVQWTVPEMTDGTAWRFLKEEGMIP